jgi:hypothetical protein
MKIRSILTLGLMAASLSSLTAIAHPQGHDDEKAIPKTCAELADTRRFTDDVTYPEVKALKARCDAEKKAAPKPAPKPATEKKSG